MYRLRTGHDAKGGSTHHHVIIIGPDEAHDASRLLLDI